MPIANPPPHGCGGGAYRDVFTACLGWAYSLHAFYSLILGSALCSTSRARTPQLQGHSLKVRDI
ncbi:hypothetical protein MTsDn1_20610 [Alteromonas sp. MTD1]